MGVKSSIQLNWGNKDQDEFSVTHVPETVTPSDCAEHWHSCFEILMVKKGSRKIVVRDRDFILSAGEIAVIPPYIPHASLTDGGVRCEFIVVGYAESLIYTAENTIGSFKYLLPFRKEREPGEYILTGSSPLLSSIRETVGECADLFAAVSLTYELDIRIALMRLHSLLYRYYLCLYDGESSADGTQKVRLLCDLQLYIEKHLSETVSPYAAADELHVSHSHLCRIVHSSMGMTITELIRTFKLNYAERLLLDHEEMSVTEIGCEIGMPDTSYFIKCFRACKGMTPGEFRRRFGQYPSGTDRASSR